MAFKKELTHPYGIVHDGAIASLADSAVALALLSLVEPQHKITTIEFKINYFAPVFQGRVLAQAKILHKGSRTAVGDVNVTNEKGEVVAKVIATYSITGASEDQPMMPKIRSN
jgi:acyl-CoA thioesterase